MGYEIDFLPVGPESKSGDAIAMRFGNLSGERNEHAIVIIDGGFAGDGQKLIDHINEYYGKTNVIDLVIATHPHGDHIAGLETVLEKMEVRELWLHKPWDESHTNNIARWFSDGRVTDNSVRAELRKSLESVRELEKIATRKGIPIVEPFVGVYKDFGFGRLDVVGPTKEYYGSLLPSFASTPEAKTLVGSLLSAAMSKVSEAVARLFESWDVETLDDNGESSAENNSSVIALLSVDGKKMLFTADAGIPALTNVADVLEANEIGSSSLNFIQVPHHGSRRNVGPTILDRVMGGKLPEDQKDVKRMTAFCSCAVNGEPKHPSKKVANAFKRRGSPVHVTQGYGKVHWDYAPSRAGWSTSIPLELYSEVEEEE